MKKYLAVFLSICFVIYLSACNTLQKMKPVPRSSFIPPNMVLVNFVRPSSIAGGLQTRELWDGEKYVGSISSGSMIQYIAEPRKHMFLTNNYNHGWTDIEVDLKPNKEYYIKVEAFMDGFRFEEIDRVVHGNTRWIDDLDVYTIDLDNAKPVSQSAKAEVKAAIERAKKLQ